MTEGACAIDARIARLEMSLAKEERRNGYR